MLGSSAIGEAGNRRMRIVAIDFETANASPTSACSVGLVLFEGERVLRQYYSLIRTPTEDFRFTDIHKLTWSDVEKERAFDAVWSDMRPLVGEAEFLIAHNATFDRDVLLKTCGHYGISAPALRFGCTLRLARAAWKLKSHRLSALAKHFDIPLDHHNALSDAMACARIFMRAMAEGHSPATAMLDGSEAVEEPPAPRPPARAVAPARLEPAAAELTVPLPPARTGWLRPMVRTLAGAATAAAVLMVP